MVACWCARAIVESTDTDVDHPGRFCSSQPTFEHLIPNGIESLNAQIKTGGTSDIQTASRRRTRGIAAASIFSAFLLVQHNLTRIASFLKKEFEEHAQILVRQTVPALRSRDAHWTNAYTATTPNVVIPIVLPLSEPPLRT